MLPIKLKLFNQILGLIASILFAAGMIFWLSTPDNTYDISIDASILSSDSPFKLGEDAYKEIIPQLLTLKQPPLQVTIPDLQQNLFYLGPTLRPDLPQSPPRGTFSWKGQKDYIILTAEEIYYLSPSENDHTAYQISPLNQPTPLWLIMTLGDKSAEARIFMKQDIEGDNEPFIHTQTFQLQKREGNRIIPPDWTIGDLKVDGSLLMRQQARWMGEDIFLKLHGGTEFAFTEGKQKIDFGIDTGSYYLYLGEGDYVYWYENRWQPPQSIEEPDRLKLPLLHFVKKEDRLMRLEIWAPEGKGMLPLNLIRMPAPWSPAQIIHEFKFYGVRSRQAWILDIQKERRVVKPKEWLLRTDGKWVSLDSADQIDAYVDGKLRGELIILDRIAHKDGKQVLQAHLFNVFRTEMLAFEIPLTSQQDNKSNLIPKVQPISSNDEQPIRNRLRKIEKREIIQEKDGTLILEKDGILIEKKGGFQGH